MRWRAWFAVVAVGFLLCSCDRTQGGIFYNGEELDEAELRALIDQETEPFASDAVYTLVAFEGKITSPDRDSVFWTKSGSVFHYDRLCRHLSNAKEVYYGTAEDAVSCEKTRACLACEKQQPTEEEG